MQTLVIGAGLAGLTIAQALLERGEAVRILEAREGVGLETSFANGGMLTPSMPEPWNGPGVHRHLAASLLRRSPSMQLRFRALPSLLSWGIAFLRNSAPSRFYDAVEDNFRLASYSRDRTLELTEKLQLDYELSNTGTLCLFRSNEPLAERRVINNLLAGLGMTSREIGRDEIAQIEPALAGVACNFTGGFWFPDDAIGDAHLFCNALARQIVARGADIDTRIRVTGLLSKNGRIDGVDTDRGRIDSKRVIVAAGVRSPGLLRGVGMSLAVKPAKGYSLTFDCAGLGELPGVAIVDDESHAVVSRFGDRVRVVGTAEFAGFDKSTPRYRMDHLFGVLESLLPRLVAKVDREAGTPWAGLRPMSSDGRPFIGAGSVDGLFINTGHGALGWTMAAGSAQLLADQIMGTPTDIDYRPFLPGRD